MSKAQFAQRRDGRVAAMQYLYAWSLNVPSNLAEDLRVFFESLEQPREHYAFGEELIHGTLQQIARSMRAMRSNSQLCASVRIRASISAICWSVPWISSSPNA